MIDTFSDGWDNWLTRSDIDWAYVRINRAGSTWLKEYFTSNGFETIEPRKLRLHHKLVILREPLERFFSGVNCIEGLTSKFILQPKTILLRYGSDPHIKAQSDFLRNVDLNNCTFIKYGPNIVDDVQHFLKEHNTVMHFTPPSIWFNKPTVSEYNNLKDADASNLALRKLLNEVYENDPFVHQIVDHHLKNDYNLYNNVKWYGTN